MHYSPFDALGLDFGNYTEQEIHKAYKLASKYCHPDKRNQQSIPENWWPTQIHLEESRAFLLSQKHANHYYRGYPRTFFPGKPGLPVYRMPGHSFFACTNCGVVDATCPCDEAISISFIVCGECRMILPYNMIGNHNQDAHNTCELCGEIPEPGHFASRHPDKVCQVCSQPETGDMLAHLQTAHTLRHCIGCQASSVKDLIRHFQDGHRPCPLCLELYSTESIHSHLANHHKWQHCDDCEDSTLDDLERHVLSEHAWISCPFPDCLRVMVGELWRHVRADHAYKRCLACPQIEADFAEATEHVVAVHTKELCPMCRKAFPKLDLEDHLVDEHDWLRCPYCSRANPDEEELRQHIADDDKIQPCLVCSIPHSWHQMKPHLIRDHSWLPCPFCSEPFEAHVIFEHFQLYHKQCSKCNFAGTLEGLNSHILNEHDGLYANIATWPFLKISFRRMWMSYIRQLTVHCAAGAVFYSICPNTSRVTFHPAILRSRHAIRIPVAPKDANSIDSNAIFVATPNKSVKLCPGKRNVKDVRIMT